MSHEVVALEGVSISNIDIGYNAMLDTLLTTRISLDEILVITRVSR